MCGDTVASFLQRAVIAVELIKLCMEINLRESPILCGVIVNFPAHAHSMIIHYHNNNITDGYYTTWSLIIHNVLLQTPAGQSILQFPIHTAGAQIPIWIFFFLLSAV